MNALALHSHTNQALNFHRAFPHYLPDYGSTSGNVMEPVSHFFYSHRLKLQFWDFGQNGKPALILVHGSLDQARSWDWVARRLREDFHVYALDLRGHGNSAQPHGALYSVAEYVLDLSALADIVNDFPVYLVGHSLGAYVSLMYAGIYPDRVRKLIAIEGLSGPPASRVRRPAAEKLRRWVETAREMERRESRSYPDLASAVKRMKEANPHLSDEIAQHLTWHGTNLNADGSLVWKFDNYARLFPPYGLNQEDVLEILGQIICPTLLFWGMESWALPPEEDGRSDAIKTARTVKVPGAGHWVHHDQLDIFLNESTAFLKDGGK
jgi:pimeloyl-ACP methyl ester carboxylesterase